MPAECYCLDTGSENVTSAFFSCRLIRHKKQVQNAYRGRAKRPIAWIGVVNKSNLDCVYFGCTTLAFQIGNIHRLVYLRQESVAGASNREPLDIQNEDYIATIRYNNR
jgi:hypothetical protein